VFFIAFGSCACLAESEKLIFLRATQPTTEPIRWRTCGVEVRTRPIACYPPAPHPQRTSDALRSSRRFRIALIGLFLVLSTVIPQRSSGLTSAQEARAKQVASDAIYAYRARRYKRAAKLFMRVWKLTDKSMPRMLRNAARSWESAGKVKRALTLWERLERPLGASDLTRKEAALMRKEARIHARDLRLVMGQQLFERAEQHYSKKAYREAGDAFIRAYQASGRQSPSYLRFAARAYEKGRLIDEALIGWRHYKKAAGVGEIGREEAQKRQAALEAEVASLHRNRVAMQYYQRGRFKLAADAFLQAYKQAPSRRLSQLRMAALSAQRGKQYDRARGLWRRYGGAKQVTALGRQEADDRVRDIEIRARQRQAKRLMRGKKYRAAGDLWLEVYAVSLDKSPRYLHKAALAFEKAKSFKRARTLWLRYSTSPTVSDDEQEVAFKRAEQLDASQKSGAAPVAQPPLMLAVARHDPRPVEGPRLCVGCLVTLGAGAVATVGGLLVWSDAEDRSMKLSAKLGGDVVTGIDKMSAQQEQDAVNTGRTMGAVLMGIGAAALIGGVIAEVVVQTGGRDDEDEDEDTAWLIAPAGNGIVARWSWR